MKNKLFMLANWRFVAGIFVISVLATILYIGAKGITNNIHEKITRDNSQLRNLDSLIKKNIIESRYGLKNNYNALVAYSTEMI